MTCWLEGGTPSRGQQLGHSCADSRPPSTPSSQAKLCPASATGTSEEPMARPAKDAAEGGSSTGRAAIPPGSPFLALIPFCSNGAAGAAGGNSGGQRGGEVERREGTDSAPCSPPTPPPAAKRRAPLGASRSGGGHLLPPPREHSGDFALAHLPSSLPGLRLYRSWKGSVRMGVRISVRKPPRRRPRPAAG